MSLTEPYITFKDGENLFVLQVSFPHYIARIQYHAEENTLMQGQIPMYRIFLVFQGSLGGNRLIMREDWKQSLHEIMVSMCDWYRVNRVEKMPERFKKYKL